MEEEAKEGQVEEEKQEKEEEKTGMPELEKPLDKMTVKELREVAKDIPGLTGVTAMKKEDLLQILREEWGIKEEAPAKEKKKAGVKSAYSVKDLKLKIVQLRQEKAAAREAGDRHGIDILRRRINRLKKQTRKIVAG